MLGSGHIIGKIIDDFALLMKQVELRNKIKQYDLTLLCENFFRDVLNIVYNLDLINTNRERSNSPGIDLGCKKKKIAYQITSIRTSAKVNKTLEALTDEQINEYEKVVIFIIGEKQNSYTGVNVESCPNLTFNVDEDIKDIKDLLQDIVILLPNKLEDLFSLFKSQFRRVTIDFEVLDEDGNYDSSLENKEESIPNKKPLTAANYLNYLKLDDEQKKEEFENLINLYSTLSLLPRITREYLLIIVKRGKPNSEEIIIQLKTLEHVLRLDSDELILEMNLLLEIDLIEIEMLSVGYSEREAYYIIISNRTLLEIFEWANKENISLRKLINSMDWSVLD